MPYCEHCEHCNAETLDGATLRKRRLRTGLTLRSLAQMVGITPAYLSDIELNRRRVKLTGTGQRLNQELEKLEYGAAE